MAIEPQNSTPSLDTFGIPFRLVPDQSISIPVIIDRPSSKQGRTFSTAQVANQTAAYDLIHAASLNQPILMTDFILTGQNSGAVATFTIQNYTVPMIPVTLPKGTVTNPTPFSFVVSFKEPVPFPINIWLNPGTATCTYSFMYTGYVQS